MKAALLLSLSMLLSVFCSAQETIPSTKFLLASDDELLDRHFEFGSGYTNVTLFDYVVKITAEQRFSDKQLLVVVFPQEQGVSFTIQKVEIGKAPKFNLKGPVAKVTGVFRAQVNMSNPLHREMTVPIQISPVNEYTVSENEALIQGNHFIQKHFTYMITGDEP